MKNYLFFVLVILLLVTIDHPIIAKPRQQLLDEFITFIGQFSKVKTELASDKVLEKVSERLKLPRTAQNYINKQLATDISMDRFNTRYCVNKERNNFVYDDDLRQVFKFISQAKR
jgi:hypothetical protein